MYVTLLCILQTGSVTISRVCEGMRFSQKNYHFRKYHSITQLLPLVMRSPVSIYLVV